MRDYSKFIKQPSLILWNIWTRVARFVKSDELYLRVYYRLRTGKKLDLDNPKSFTEKIQWLKIYCNRTPECSVMVDKYAVKKYVADRIGEEYIIPTYGVWDNFDDIDISSLPNQFVLKTTHSSGGIYICKDKSLFDYSDARKKIVGSLKREIVYRSREYQYGGVRPRILAEKYMEDETGELKDYKFFCFNGSPKVLFYASDRYSTNKGGVKFDYYDMDYNLLPITSQGHGHSDVLLTKSPVIEKMKKLSAILSKGYPFLRVDFYCIRGAIFFGELTFHHDGGIVPFEPEEWDYKLGEMIQLPQKKKLKWHGNMR